MWRIATMAGLTLISAVAEARAQEEVPRGETVLSRSRPAYDPLGQRIGGFILYPDLQVQESYDSNIFATSGNTAGDFITSIDPSISLKSNWNNHALNFGADAHIARYASHASEDYEDYTVSGDGRIDILHDFRVAGGLGYKVRHEPRSSPNDQGGIEPTRFDDLAANLAVEKEFNRLSFRLNSTFDRYRYTNVRTRAGTEINERVRDRDEETLTLRTAYELAPLRQVYMLTGYNWRRYDQSADPSGVDRSSSGYTLALGTSYDLTGLIFVDVFAGYRKQNYTDARLGAVQGITGGLKFTWNVTALTTVTASLTRDVQETIVANSAGYFSTVVGVQADHELLRNLLLNVRTGYERDSFHGVDRTDNVYQVGLGAKYLINNNFWLSGGYDHRERASSIIGGGYTDDTVFIRVSSHL